MAAYCPVTECREQHGRAHLTPPTDTVGRHRDDATFAEAMADSCEALIAGADATAAVGQASPQGRSRA